MSSNDAGPSPRKLTILDATGDREQHVDRIARLIEARGADDDGYAARFLRAMIARASEKDKEAVIELVADIDAWRRARRTYRHFFG